MAMNTWSTWALRALTISAFALSLGCQPPANAEPKEKASTFTASSSVTTLTKGSDGKATVTIVPAKGYKWNLQYPAKLTFAADGAHVALTKKEFKQLAKEFDASEKKASIHIPMKGTSTGKEIVKGTAKFSVCNERTCLIETAEVKLSVEVNE